MSRTTHGTLPLGGAFQPNSRIVEENDGTIQGTGQWVIDHANLQYGPQLDDPHPQEPRAIITRRTITYGANAVDTIDCEFFGIIDDPTDNVISYIGSPDREAIFTHPDFVSTLAGTPDAPKNGAEFDKDGTFLDFRGGQGDGADELFGVRFWLKATSQITATYWTSDVPSITKRIEIVDKIDGFKAPDDVTDFLRIDTPYRQIGPFYQMSSIYLGSDESGWSQLIYGDE